jgi:hypothetical protein
VSSSGKPLSGAGAEPTVAVQIFKVLLGPAASQGVAPGPLVNRTGLQPELLDVDGRVLASIVRTLWEERPGLCQDEWFGLKLAAMWCRIPRLALSPKSCSTRHRLAKVREAVLPVLC